jgi:hypothetical protein
MTGPELELTKESHELAKAWVSANWNRNAKAVRYAAPEVRPARLGLGAKYVPHKAETDRAQSSAERIDAKLRKDLGLSVADAGRESPRRAVDGRVHRAQPSWAKGVDKAQAGNASSSSDSDSGGDDRIDSRTSSLGRAAARGNCPEGGRPVQIKRQRDPQAAPNKPARQKQKRGPVVQAASALLSDTQNGTSLTAQQRKKQRRRARKAAAAAAAAASAAATEPAAPVSPGSD